MVIIIEQVTVVFFFFWLHLVLVASCGTFFFFRFVMWELFPWWHMGSVVESLVGLAAAKLVGS